MTSRDYKGQVYRRIGSEPYTRRDGTKTVVLIWRSNCMTCGAEFECITANAPACFKPLRNCPDHRRRLRWAERVRVTDSSTIGPLPDGRPVAPLAAYGDERAGRR